MGNTTSPHSSNIFRFLKSGRKGDEKQTSKTRGHVPVPQASKTTDALVRKTDSLDVSQNPKNGQAKLPLQTEKGSAHSGNAPLAAQPLKSILRTQIGAPKKKGFSLRAVAATRKKKGLSFSDTDAVILHKNVEVDKNDPRPVKGTEVDVIAIQRITVREEKVPSKSEQLRTRNVDFLETGIEKTPLRERNRAKRIFPADYRPNNPVQSLSKKTDL